MPRKSSNPTATASKTGHVVPEWAKKVKDFREKAKKTQVEVEKAIKATVNTLSLVENGRRQFSPTQRNLFFEFIGQPEDSSIPTTVRDLTPSAPKKAAKPGKPVTKRKTKSTKPAKAAKVAVESEPALVAIPGTDIKEAEPGPAGISDANATVAAAPKPIRKPKTRKSIEAAPVQVPPMQATPIRPAKSAPTQAVSPVKEAVLCDISRILSNPGLSDAQAKRLHGLFTSLAVNALLGE
jgi:transcriptional regulator with XRE-family HTH domain